MTHATLVRYKLWADRGLYDVALAALDRLQAPDDTILLRLLDHIHVVDRIFQHHLRGLPHGIAAPRSDGLPAIGRLADDALGLSRWYVDYAEGLSPAELDQPLDFTFTSGKPARMTRGQILAHVCLHGTYHRGAAGILLQKNGVMPNDDRLTDFLEAAA